MNAGVTVATSPTELEHAVKHLWGSTVPVHAHIKFGDDTKPQLFNSVHNTVAQMQRREHDGTLQVPQRGGKFVEIGTRAMGATVAAMSMMMMTGVAGGAIGAAAPAAAAAFATAGLGYTGGEESVLVRHIGAGGAMLRNTRPPTPVARLVAAATAAADAPEQPASTPRHDAADAVDDREAPSRRTSQARGKAGRLPGVNVAALMATFLWIWDDALRASTARLQRLLMCVCALLSVLDV